MPDDMNAAGHAPAACRLEPRRSIGRITRRADYLAANSGVRVALPPFVLLLKPAGHEQPRVGFTVSRRVGNAVARNRARRRLREAARQIMPEMAIPGADHVFIARALPDELPFEELLSFMRKALAKARRKLGGAQ